MMFMQRSNVRLYSNVHIRTPGCEAQADESFKKAVRTREAILALHPLVKNSVGIDWSVARASLTLDQIEVLVGHHACPVCGRWDRWPVTRHGASCGEAVGWVLSYTPLGCICSQARDEQLFDKGGVKTAPAQPSAVSAHSPRPQEPATAARRRGRGDLRGGL